MKKQADASLKARDKSLREAVRTFRSAEANGATHLMLFKALEIGSTELLEILQAILEDEKDQAYEDAYEAGKSVYRHPRSI